MNLMYYPHLSIQDYSNFGPQTLQAFKAWGSTISPSVGGGVAPTP